MGAWYSPFLRPLMVYKGFNLSDTVMMLIENENFKKYDK